MICDGYCPELEWTVVGALRWSGRERLPGRKLDQEEQKSDSGHCSLARLGP
jgi:hypothetical protein